MRAVKETTIVPVLLLLLATGVRAEPVDEAPAAIAEMTPPAGDLPADAGLVGDCDAAGVDPWFFSADALILDRTIGSNQVLVTGTNAFVVLSGSDFDFDHGVGPRLEARRSFGDWSAEGVYFAIFDQRASAFFSRVGVAFGSPIPGAGFTFNYFSTLNNAEFNLRRQVNERLSVLAGFRYVSLEEDVEGQFFTSVIGPTATNYHAENDMFGGQVGGNWRCIQGARGNTALDLGSKLGLFGNSESMNSSFSNSLGVAQVSADAGELAFLAEISIIGSLRVWDCLWIRGGYQMMWLDGIALAPAQLATANFFGAGSRVNNDTCVFYHGAVAGAEFRW